MKNIEEKNWNPKAKAKGIRGEGASQPQRIEGEIILPRGLDSSLRMKRYAELIRKNKKLGIKSLSDNNLPGWNAVVQLSQ